MSELDRISEDPESTCSKIMDPNKQDDESTISDINGNSSKIVKIKTFNRNSSVTPKYTDRPKNTSKRDTNMNNKSTRSGSGIVKIAPHPMISNEVAGRLRSSHRWHEDRGELAVTPHSSPSLVYIVFTP